MIRYLAWLLVAASTNAFSGGISVTPCDLGERYRYAKVECHIELHNSSNAPIHLREIKSLLPADKSGSKELVVPAKASAYLPVVIQLDKGVGWASRYFVATSDEPGNPVYQLIARAFVNSVLDDADPQLDFGAVDVESEIPRKTIWFSSQEFPGLRIERVLSAPDYLQVSIGPDGRSIAVQPSRGLDWGVHDDVIRVAINAPQQSEESVRVRLDAHGAVVPDGNPMNLGLLRQGKENEARIRLVSRDHRNFRVGEIAVTGLDAKVESMPCANDEKGCSLLKVTLNSSQAPGEIRARLDVDLPDYHRRLPILLWGMLVRPETKIVPLGEGGEDQGALAGSFTSEPSAQSTISVADAIKQAADQEPPSGVGPLLKWRVANESAIHGYIVFRSESAGGPFRRINERTIPSSGGDNNSLLYQWRDTSAKQGSTYWYQIGMVHNNGHKQMLTGPQKVVAK